MSGETCCIDGRAFKKLEREYICIVCARKVCGEHSTDFRTNPFTGERGHACRRCLAETVDGTLEAQLAALYRQVHGFGPLLKALADEVTALRQEVGSLPKAARLRTSKPAKSAKKSAQALPRPKAPAKAVD